MANPHRLLALLLCGGCVLPSTLGDLGDLGDTGHASGGGSWSDADEHGGQTGQNASADASDGADGASDGTGGADDEMGDGSALPPAPAEEWVVPEQCAEVAAESYYCLTSTWGGTRLIGVDTGRTCAVGPEISSYMSPSFAWRGMSVVVCGTPDEEFRVGRFHLLTGTFETSDVECQVVTDIGDQILVASSLATPQPRELTIYDDFAAIVAHDPAATLGFGISGTRMWTDGEILLDAWHASDTIWRYTTTGEPLGDLVLGGYDGWIRGMAIVGGVLRIVVPGDDQDLVASFDPDTGAALGTVPIDDVIVPNGLRCRPGEGP